MNEASITRNTMKKRTRDYFVTGTDTEIGKTLISAALLEAFQRRDCSTIGMKPVLHNEDVDLLKAASSVQAESDLIAPYLMQIPAAPHLVAALENRQISVAHIQSCYAQLIEKAEVVIVEGVGGFCVPLNAEVTTLDLAQQLALPVILVVGMRLGCINHALLTAQAIEAAGLRLAGWVANTVDPDMGYLNENVTALMERLPAPLLGRIPRMVNPSAEQVADLIDVSLLK
jgi:dethiobiotin synthetase